MFDAFVKVMLSPMSSMALMLGLVQVARRIDLNDPQVVMKLRIAYGVSQVLGLLFCLWLRARINRIADKKHYVEVEEPPKPFTNEEPKKTKMTVQDYDLAEVNKQIQQTLVSSGILMAIHSYFGYAQPLFLQAIIPWKALLTLPIVRIHFWGCKAEGDLARPFKAPNPFGDLVPNEEQKTEEAEKIEDKASPKRKGGKKEE